MIYARIQDGVVAEVFTPPDGVGLENCFTAELAAQFEPCGEGVLAGWVRNGGKFSAPQPIIRKIDEPAAPTLSELRAELSALQKKIGKVAGASS